MTDDDILKLWRAYEGRGEAAVVLFARTLENASARQVTTPDCRQCAKSAKFGCTSTALCVEGAQYKASAAPRRYWVSRHPTNAGTEGIGAG